MNTRLKKCTAILLCVLLLISILPAASASGVNGYYNVDYLEDYAAAAYGEQGLGAVYTPQATTWKVWSPAAKHVQLRLYETGSDEETGAAVRGTYTMEKNNSTGVWSITLEGDFKNVYYTYLVTARGITRETRDVCAKAAGVNGKRSMVVDLDATDPTGWENDEHVLLDESTDAVIWEIHVRDFSVSESSGVSPANRGKYLAFTEDETVIPGDADESSTCVNYLKEMGVNTVHLLPVYDFGSVDETVTNDPANRNWGYDPINYNVPEGSYSTNPYDGNTRITEFKQMVQALHEAGISVVMDVVYNHTFDIDTHEYGHPVLYNNAFNDTVPGYYFRMSGPSSWYNGSGCGNVTASDKLMYRKYMIESVRYWAEEYHIDGFRFDLMGCHDVETMNLIRAELDGLYDGDGEKILMYGEPWTGGDAGIANGCTQNNAETCGLNARIGLFCDWMRDAIKGNPDGDGIGWIQGDTTQASAVYGGLSANDGRLSARSQTVTYADAHDNLILWDKIVKSNGGSNYADYSNQTWIKQLNLAKTIVLMSQGMAFSVGGTEFARSKQGDHNSYNAPDTVNAIDWNVRKTNAALADYYKGLIQIREAFSPITDPNVQYQKNNLTGSSNSCIAFRIPNQTAGEWSNLILILNDSASSATVTLPEGSWNLIANGVQAGLTTLATCSDSYTVPGYGSAILVNDSAITPPEPETNEDLYLIGYINGADYGCEADSANTGIYKFEDGSLTATFTQDSYVYVKTGDNSRWYMTDGWLGTNVTSATLYNTDVLNGNGNKLFVPGGVEVTFTLTEGENDSYVLSYTYEGELPAPAAPDYYLIGYINGEDHGCESDWQNPGDYHFVNGTLNTTFTQDSYVFVKTGDNANWYMTDGWLGTDVSSATLYNTGTHTFANGTNKLFVPGGVNVTFTLAEGENDTLTLSYTASGSRAMRDPTEYYLFGYINGADYGTGDDYENLGDYHFVNGSLTTSFAADSYVGVKTGDNAHWFMTDGWQGQVNSATLYDTAAYELGEDANKLYVPGGVEVSFTLTEGEENTLTLSYTTGDPVTPVPSGDAKNAVILHCWNWSYDTIRENLQAIKDAGYTAVQTSPAQPHSGWKSGTIGTGDWWMLYQPLGLHIAGENESWLGDADDLEALCTAAHALGIEVIVDVVSNHLCNGYNDIAAGGTDPYDDSQIIATDANGKHGYQFEVQPDARVLIHNPELTNADFRGDYVFCNDTNTEAVVHGNIGMPDLKTETAKVQNSVLNYLKELIDVGVDGFRFDAAKHIETPSDGTYASDFWPTVINGAEEYAEDTYNKSVWSYGEVLSTAGHDRKMNYYAPYIDMTEISYAYTITEGFGKDHSASKVANQQFKDWLGVGVETLSAADLVLMAESHDTYAQSAGSFSEYGPEVINKAWAVAVARADASALYFARPQGYEYGLNEDDPSLGYPVGTLGACEDYNWMDTEVAEANKFHTAFAGSPEAVYAAGNLVVVERYNAEDCGAVIANATGTTASLSFSAQHLADGTYYDQITGNSFTVSGGTVTGQMGTTGIAVLRSTEPNACDHPLDQQYTVTKEATCTEAGYVAIYCHACGRMVELVSETPALGHIDANNDNRCDRCNLFLGVVTVYFIDGLDWVDSHDYFTNVNAYAYGEGGQNADWPGTACELIGYSTDEHGIWKIELNPEAWQKVKFVGLPGETGEVKTVDLPFVTDAVNNVAVYRTNGDTEAGAYGSEYLCDTVADLEAVCAHTGYEIVTVNGAEHRICDCCGKDLDEPAPAEPIETDDLEVFCSVSVGTDMIMSFTTLKEKMTNYDKFWIEVVKHEPTEDKVYKYGVDQEEALLDSNQSWKARFNHIFAKEMGLNVEARVYAQDANGQVWMSPAKSTTIRDYLGGRLTATNNKVEQRVLAADMLNYGAAAQLFLDYDTEHLVNEELTEAQLAKLEEYETKELPLVEKTNSNYKPEGATDILFTSVTLGNEVLLKLNSRLPEQTEGVQILVKDHLTGDTVTTLDTNFGGSSFQGVFHDIGASKMRVEYDFVTLVNGVETGNTRTWSVEAYVGEIRAGNKPLKTNLANALLTYGDSAAAYKAAQQSS